MIPLEELLEFMDNEKRILFVKIVRERGYPTTADDFESHVAAVDRKKLSELIQRGDPQADQYLGVDSIVRIERENGKEGYVIEQRHSKVARQAELYWGELGSGALSDINIGVSRFRGTEALIRLAHFWEVLGAYYTKLMQAAGTTQEGLTPYMQKVIASLFAAWDNHTRVPYRTESGRELVDRAKGLGIDLLKFKMIRDNYEHPERHRYAD